MLVRRFYAICCLRRSTEGGLANPKLSRSFLNKECSKPKLGSGGSHRHRAEAIWLRQALEAPVLTLESLLVIGLFGVAESQTATSGLGRVIWRHAGARRIPVDGHRISLQGRRRMRACIRRPSTVWGPEGINSPSWRLETLY
jgi:hypothetical protein